MQIGTSRGLNLNFMLINGIFLLTTRIFLINGQENWYKTVLLQLCLVVVFKIERSVPEKVFSDHILCEVFIIRCDSISEHIPSDWVSQ